MTSPFIFYIYEVYISYAQLELNFGSNIVTSRFLCLLSVFKLVAWMWSHMQKDAILVHLK